MVVGGALEDSLKSSGGVAEVVHADAHVVEHIEEEVGEGGAVLVLEVLTDGDFSAAFSGDEEGEIVVVVTVTITDSAAVEEHRVVEKGAVSVVDFAHAVEDVGELLGVIDVDFFLFQEFIGGFAVVADVVVSVGDIDFLVGAVAAFVCEHEGGDSGEVGLEGEDHHVAHEADVFAPVAGDATGHVNAVEHHGFAGGFVVFEAEFDVSDGCEIFFDLLGVAGAETCTEPLGIFGDEIKDGEFVLAAFSLRFGGLTVAGGAEEPFEQDTGVDFFGVGGGFGSPGDAAGVGAGIAGVAISGEGTSFATDFEACEFGSTADLLGSDLVGGDSDLDVGASGFSGLDAGEPGGGGSGMIAGAVAVGEGFHLTEAGDNAEF